MVVREDYIHSAPELAVEVLSPGNTRREREDKLRDYEFIGVHEAWVLLRHTRDLNAQHQYSKNDQSVSPVAAITY